MTFATDTIAQWSRLVEIFEMQISPPNVNIWRSLFCKFHPYIDQVAQRLDIRPLRLNQLSENVPPRRGVL